MRISAPRFDVTNLKNQASWFVVTGSNFEIDGHNTGGIQGNGQVGLYSYEFQRFRSLSIDIIILALVDVLHQPY